MFKYFFKSIVLISITTNTLMTFEKVQNKHAFNPYKADRPREHVLPLPESLKVCPLSVPFELFETYAQLVPKEYLKKLSPEETARYPNPVKASFDRIIKQSCGSIFAPQPSKAPALARVGMQISHNDKNQKANNTMPWQLAEDEDKNIEYLRKLSSEDRATELAKQPKNVGSALMFKCLASELRQKRKQAQAEPIVSTTQPINATKKRKSMAPTNLQTTKKPKAIDNSSIKYYRLP